MSRPEERSTTSDNSSSQEKLQGAGQGDHRELNLIDLTSPKEAQTPILCHETNDTKLLSMVGPILSFELHSQGDCAREAHPFGQTDWHAIDMRRMNPDYAIGNGYAPGEPAKLTDYFAAKDIRDALIKDSVVQKALASINIRASDVKTLEELQKDIGAGIDYISPEKPAQGSAEQLCFSLDKDLLSHFAFDHVEGDKVAVRIGLSGTGVCRENLTQIGILLTIPPELKEATTGASSGKNGFLMRNGKSAQSSFSWQFTE